jgi:intracellular sulfur oxidation DsrE/DsrF family protein
MIKVIFHVDEMDKWNLTLHNVQNLMDAIKSKDFLIEVLANSEAVRFFIGSTEEGAHQRMTDLARTGVQFSACNNALNGYGIPKEQLPEYIQVVPAGVLHLAEKQHQGYAYIKP